MRISDWSSDVCSSDLAHGFDFTGWTIERLTSGATLAFTRHLYGTVVTRAVPVYSEGHFRWAEKEYHWTKRLHLPLSRAGDGQVDLVLVGQYFEQQQGRCELVPAARPAAVAAGRIAGPRGLHVGAPVAVPPPQRDTAVLHGRRA